MTSTKKQPKTPETPAGLDHCPPAEERTVGEWAKYEALLAEHTELPERRAQALADDDQDAFFQIERRIATIDVELADAWAKARHAEAEVSWEAAEELIGLEDDLAAEDVRLTADLNELGDKVRDTWFGLSDAARMRHEADVSEVVSAREVVRARRPDVSMMATRWILRAETIEARTASATDTAIPYGEGIRARPPRPRTTVIVRGPKWDADGNYDPSSSPAGSLHNFVAGDVLPRWVVRLVANPDVWLADSEELAVAHVHAGSVRTSG